MMMSSSRVSSSRLIINNNNNIYLPNNTKCSSSRQRTQSSRYIILYTSPFHRPSTFEFLLLGLLRLPWEFSPADWTNEWRTGRTREDETKNSALTIEPEFGEHTQLLNPLWSPPPPVLDLLYLEMSHGDSFRS